MAPDGVVLVDPVRHHLAGLRPGGEVITVQQLKLQRGVKRLRSGVIQRRTGATHGLAYLGASADLSEHLTGVLTALSVWKTTPATCPPRTAIAMHNAARASSAL